MESEGWVRQDFWTATEFLRWNEQNINQVPKKQRSSENGDHKFTQTHTMDEALELFTIGWPEGVVEMAGYAEKIERVLLERVPHEAVVHSLTGSDIDMTAYLTGAPENMLEWQIRPQPHEGVRLLVNCGHRAGVKANVIMSRGAAVVAMVRALHLLNVPTEVDLVWAARAIAGQGGHEVRIRVSSPGREVDIERLAFMVAHPSMYRRLIFGVRERMDDAFRTRMLVPGGYGSAVNVMEDPEASIIMPGPNEGTHHWATPDTAVEWTLNRFAEIGIDLEAA